MSWLTDVLDLVGLLLLAVAASLLVADWTVPGAIAVAGCAVLTISWLIDRRKGAER